MNQLLAFHNKRSVCQCGCGEEIEKYNCRGQEKRFAKGHNIKFLRYFGEAHHLWKGGRSKHSEGYMEARCPEHPFANNRGYVMEHRLIWEQHNKACLLKWIDIHHINGNKKDNRIENLEPISRSEHGRYHSRRYHQSK